MKRRRAQRQERPQEPKRRSISSETWDLGEQTISVTHLEKVYWPQAGFTKRDLLHYYQGIALVMLPYLHDRPVTLRVFPQGINSFSYYRRDCPPEAPSWLRQVSYQPRTVAHTIPLPLIDTAAGLLWFANHGAIEFHCWGSHLPDLTQPDLAIFDLDPGSGASFETVREGALRLRDLLEQADVRSYPKTSGGRGLHILAPLKAGPSFEDIRHWVKGIGEQLTSRFPDLFALSHGATHQGDRLTIDSAQNSLGRNTAAPYTLRASPACPLVSAPLTWEEVEDGTIQPSFLTPLTVLERVKRRGDLFAPVLQAEQDISEHMERKSEHERPHS